MQEQKQLDTFAGFGNPFKPVEFDFEYKWPVAPEPKPVDNFSGLGGSGEDEDGTFTKSSLRFKVGDQIRVKCGVHMKKATLISIRRASNRAYLIEAEFSEGGSILGIFSKSEVEAA